MHFGVTNEPVNLQVIYSKDEAKATAAIRHLNSSTK